MIKDLANCKDEATTRNCCEFFFIKIIKEKFDKSLFNETKQKNSNEYQQQRIMKKILKCTMQFYKTFWSNVGAL